ncbi:MAG: Imm72 family immunity protein [Proteobacteria bacterium]|nr:Imm72 family immunity protein [Pseudomonadota bacterium]
MNVTETELGRRRLFWIIKKWSSYTVWQYHAEQFDTFVKAYENAIETWPKGEAPPEYNLQFAYKAQALFQQGLAELAKGNRQVWRSMQRGDSYLREAEHNAFQAMEGITSEEINRFDGGERGIPAYDEWTPRLEQLRLLKEKALIKGEQFVNEPVATYIDWKPIALVGPPSIEGSINVWMSQGTDTHGTFPPNCPPTPTPQTTMIESGDVVPTDGVWELALPQLSLGSTDRLNYLIKGSTAPWAEDIDRDFDPSKQFVIPVTWRLLWQDDRYLDGIIPDESEYLLSYTDQASESVANINTITASQRVEALQPCPQAGYWYSPAKQNSRAFFKQYETMPDFHASSYGATIWYWDVNQE